ncbi:hypothetical protein, partial [Caballeronia arationis]|uniref:hypothetical protein n=1 Tax=Caballeronia arationis TaxID=1777142 RepID=UPI001F3044BC
RNLARTSYNCLSSKSTRPPDERPEASTDKTQFCRSDYLGVGTFPEILIAFATTADALCACTNWANFKSGHALKKGLIH